MNETINISCSITPTDTSAPLGLEISVNDDVIFDSEAVTQALDFSHNISLPENQEHILKLRLKNKTTQHTKVDAAGKIVSDSVLVVDKIAFDEIELGQIVTETAVYEHNFNGNGPTTQEKFHRDLGCNGTVSLKFSTPVYLWLLERI